MKQLLFRKTKPDVFVTPKPMPSLALCLLLDFIGYATYAVPFFGEFLDLIWAPISAVIFMRLFGGKKGFFGGLFNFVEELMPGLDFIPTFTLMWLWQYFSKKKNTVAIYPAVK